MLRDGEELMPLFRLGRLFHIDQSEQTTTDSLAVIIESDDSRFALVVDELLGQEQIVLKSLGNVLRGIPGISGGAIMPDGKVGLIVDVAGLFKLRKNQFNEADLQPTS